MRLLLFLQDIRNPILDALFLGLTFLGSETVVISLICVLYWCINKKLAYKMGLTFFISGMIVQTMKVIFRIDRPWVLNPAINPSQYAGATGYSFPSGHSQSATSLFGTLATFFKKKSLRIACVIIIFLVAFSRMYLGVHTPLDVTFGILITVLTLMLVSLVFDKIYDTRKYDLLVSITMLVISAAVIAVALVLLNNGDIAKEYADDCCKAAGAGIGLALAFYIERKFIDFRTETKEFWMQPIKFSLGIVGVLIIKEGLKPIIGESEIANIIRYALIVIFGLAIYPIVIKKFFSKKAD